MLILSEFCRRLLLEEPLRVIVGVDVDLGQSVVRGRLLNSLVDAVLQPGQQQLEPVALLDLFNQLVGGELSAHHDDEGLDDVLRAVDVQQASDHHRQTRRVHLEYRQARRGTVSQSDHHHSADGTGSPGVQTHTDGAVSEDVRYSLGLSNEDLGR